MDLEGLAVRGHPMIIDGFTSPESMAQIKETLLPQLLGAFQKARTPLGVLALGSAQAYGSTST